MIKLTTAENQKLVNKLYETEENTVVHLKCEKNFTVGKHSSPKKVTVILLSGHVLFSNETETMTLLPGDMIVLQPKEIHYFETVEASDLILYQQTI